MTPSQPPEQFAKFVVGPALSEIHEKYPVEWAGVEGPRGYSLRFNVDEIFGLSNWNGCVRGSQYRTAWYQAFDHQCELHPGVYTLSLGYGNGMVFRRKIDFKPDTRMLQQLLATQREFSPSGRVSSIPSQHEFRWTTLPGVSAYYVTRLAKVRAGDLSGIIHDPLYVSEAVKGNPDSQANGTTAGVRASLKLKRGQRYMWFTEILDSVEPTDTRFVVLQRMQFIHT